MHREEFKLTTGLVTHLQFMTSLMHREEFKLPPVVLRTIKNRLVSNAP